MASLSRPFRATRLACLVLCLGSAWPAALAAQPSPLDRFELRLGADALDADSTVRVDDGGTLGTTIDFESDLGLESESESFTAELSLRLGRRHQLGVSRLAADRTGARRLDQSVTFQGFTFPFDIDTESYLDLEMTGVSYTFWPFLGDRGGLGISLGAYDTEVRAGITGRATVGGVALSHTEEASESAPLPFLGIEVRLAPADRWRLRGQLRVLSVDDFDGWRGDLTVASAGVELLLLPHLWLGAGYRLIELDVESEETGFTGRADLQLDGVGVYATLSF